MILGIDPGYDITGFALLNASSPYQLIDCGVIRTDKSLSFVERLVVLRQELLNLIEETKITDCGIEKVFFSVNKKSAIQVAQARGVVLEALTSLSIPIHEYTPSQIKKAITGSGRSDKKSIQLMVKKLLNLKTIIKQDDACDAAAIAICHAHANPLKSLGK